MGMNFSHELVFANDVVVSPGRTYVTEDYHGHKTILRVVTIDTEKNRLIGRTMKNNVLYDDYEVPFTKICDIEEF